MDKEFIKNNNLEEAISRIQELSQYKHPKQSLKKLYEYTFITNRQVNEEGEDEQQPQQPQNGGMNQQPPMPQNNAPEPSMQGGGMNGQMGGEMQPEGAGMAPDGNIPPPMNNMQGGDGMQPPMGDQQMDSAPPVDDMGGMEEPQSEEEDIETTEMEPDDEVIDVDDLTQSQEATEYKIDGVDDRLSKIYDVVKNFNDKLETQEKSIMALKDEFEKRNPTPEEKLNIRSQSSYPYSETPKGYWDKKAEEDPHYNVMYDNDVSPKDEQDKFEVKKSDISGLNMKNISDTLNIDQNLKDYIGF